MKVLLAILLLTMVTSVSGETGGIDAIYNYHRIDQTLLTSGQVTPADIDDLKAGGVELVVNLATADVDRNSEEGFLITSQQINYVQIPVDWKHPTDADLKLFFAVMDARQDRKTLVHCFANYRASAFTYLYRVLKLGVEESVARKGLHAIWDEDAFAKSPQWRMFIDRHLEAGV